VDKVTLSNCLLAEGNDIEVMVLAYGSIEIELALDLVLSHHSVVIFVADFFLHQVVSLVFLCVRAHVTGVLHLDAGEALNLFLFLFG